MTANKGGIIKDTVVDMMAALLYYDRKEDMALRVGEIEENIKAGHVSIDDITAIVRSALESAIK